MTSPSNDQKWGALEGKIRTLLDRHQASLKEREALQKKLSSLETEIQAVRALRIERDKLKTERDVVRKRVLEMLQQLEKVSL